MTTVYTDKTGLYSSTQFDSKGNLWVTDFNGAIDEMKPTGPTSRPTYSGKLAKGADDLAFDKQGNMFITDTTGDPWNPTGDLLWANPQGKDVKVLMSGFAGTNGVSFTPDYERLWVSEYTGMKEDLLTLNKDHTKVTEAQVGMHGSPGIGKFDSNMVDSAGNVYQCLNEDGEILVWNEHGELQETIKIKQNLGAPEMGGDEPGDQARHQDRLPRRRRQSRRLRLHVPDPGEGLRRLQRRLDVRTAARCSSTGRKASRSVSSALQRRVTDGCEARGRGRSGACAR